MNHQATATLNSASSASQRVTGSLTWLGPCVQIGYCALALAGVAGPQQVKGTWVHWILELLHLPTRWQSSPGRLHQVVYDSLHTYLRQFRSCNLCQVSVLAAFGLVPCHDVSEFFASLHRYFITTCWQVHVAVCLACCHARAELCQDLQEEASQGRAHLES